MEFYLYFPFCRSQCPFGFLVAASNPIKTTRNPPEQSMLWPRLEWVPHESESEPLPISIVGGREKYAVEASKHFRKQVYTFQLRACMDGCRSDGHQSRYVQALDPFHHRHNNTSCQTTTP